MAHKQKNNESEKVEDKTGPESEAVEEVEIEATPGEYIFSTESVEALGEEWLDAINKAFREDPDANALWVLVSEMDKLPSAEESKSKPTSGRADQSGYEINQPTLAKLGERFLQTLETFIRLNPGADPRNALNSSAEYLKDKKVRSYKSGGKIINVDPIRI